MIYWGMRNPIFYRAFIATFLLLGLPYAATAKGDFVYIDSSSSDFITHYAPAPTGVVDPFIGTTIDVEDHMDDITFTHTEFYDVEQEEDIDYNLRAGVSYGLNKTFSLTFDPEKRKVRLEVGFLQLKKMKNLRIRTRVGLRRVYMKAVYKW